MNVGNVGGRNWWADPSGRNPGIMRWEPLAVRRGGSLFGANQAGTSQSARNSVVQLREASETLTRALNTIRGIGNNNANSPMQARRPVSDNTDALVIRTFDSNRLRGSGAADFNVDIVQLAKAQRHDGAALNSSARATESGFAAGAHHMAITVGDRQFDIHFNVSATDTNRDVQQRIANAINNRSDIAVTASVNVDAAAGTSALVLQSSQTGINENTAAGQPNFTVRSVTGNAVAVTGVEAITQQAQNAQFRVNRGFTGALQTSRSNEVDLGFGIMAELREVGSVEVSMGRDTLAQQNAFRHMVNSFNDLVRAANNANRGSALASELSGIARSFSSQLERIGISVNAEGRMQIDEARMAAAAENGDLERFATRDGSNFMSRLTRASENVSRNPAAFVEQEATGAGGLGNNPANIMNSGINFTPAQSVSMARFMNLGILFDSLM